ncbi:MAG: phage tail protein [Aeromonas veronii]
MSSFASGFAKGFVEASLPSPETGVMMDLGGLRFGVSSQEYESLRTAVAWNWAEKARYGREAALQYQGKAATTKTMEVVIVAETGRDLEFLPMVEAMGDSGEPQRLVAGHSRPVGGVSMVAGGSDLGQWCLVSLDIGESEFMRDGTAIMYQATITIKKYGEDRV